MFSQFKPLVEIFLSILSCPYILIMVVNIKLENLFLFHMAFHILPLFLILLNTRIF